MPFLRVMQEFFNLASLSCRDLDYYILFIVFINQDYYGASLQMIQIIGPCLHHFPPFVQVLCPVISRSDGIPGHVAELALDRARAPALFVQKCGCRGSEAVRGHHIAFIPQRFKRGSDGVVRHRTAVAAAGWKDIAAGSGQRPDGLKYLDGLPR